MHLPFQEGKKHSFFFFFDGALLIEFKAPFFSFLFLFPLIRKKGGKFSMNPSFALGWYFKRINQNVKKKGTN